MEELSRSLKLKYEGLDFADNEEKKERKVEVEGSDENIEENDNRDEKKERKDEKQDENENERETRQTRLTELEEIITVQTTTILSLQDQLETERMKVENVLQEAAEERSAAAKAAEAKNERHCQST